MKQQRIALARNFADADKSLFEKAKETVGKILPVLMLKCGRADGATSVRDTIDKTQRADRRAMPP